MSNSAIVKSGEGHRSHVESPLMRESLVSKSLNRGMGSKKVIQILPDCNILFVGGQSIIDRGREALLPLLDEIVRVRPKHKLPSWSWWWCSLTSYVRYLPRPRITYRWASNGCRCGG